MNFRKYIVIISKDAMPKHYLPVYGNEFWKCPNIDKVAKNGVVFNNFYATASSTGMSFYSMITGELPYLSGRKNYADEKPFIGENIFEKLARKEYGSYKSYFVWNKPHTTFLKQHLKVLNGPVEIIPLNLVREGVPNDRVMSQLINPFDKKPDKILNDISNVFEKIKGTNENVFIWIHLPHVLFSRYSLGSDIDVYDQIVGLGIEYFGIDSLYLFSDHGTMDGKRGIFNYGFDVDQPVINIPLITPNIGNLSSFSNEFVGNNQLFELLTGNLTKKDFIICDTSYYEQRLRSIAIIHNGYKLVFVKEKNKFYMFDILFDKDEKFDLLSNSYYDFERKQSFLTKTRYFYPYWSKVEHEKEILFSKFYEVYKKGSKLRELRNKFANFVVYKKGKRKAKKYK